MHLGNATKKLIKLKHEVLKVQHQIQERSTFKK